MVKSSQESVQFENQLMNMEGWEREREIGVTDCRFRKFRSNSKYLPYIRSAISSKNIQIMKIKRWLKWIFFMNVQR